MAGLVAGRSQSQQNWPANTGAVTHVYTTVFSFTTGGYVASYAV